MDTNKTQIAQTNAYWSSEGVNTVGSKSYHDYCMERMQREEEVGMFATSVIFKDVYEEELVPDMDSKTGRMVGYTYEFKHILIESPDPVHIIDVNGHDFIWIDITDVTSYSDVYNVFIKQDDINSAFQRHLIDHITENLILCNRLLEEDKAHGKFHPLNKYLSYSIAFTCIKFYNTYVAPKLGVKELVLFTTTDGSGKTIVHFA